MRGDWWPQHCCFWFAERRAFLCGRGRLICCQEHFITVAWSTTHHSPNFIPGRRLAEIN